MHDNVRSENAERDRTWQDRGQPRPAPVGAKATPNVTTGRGRAATASGRTPRLALVAPALTALALAALLSGCTIAVRDGGSTTSTTVRGGGVIVWAQLGLQFSFPGLVVVERHAGPHHFDSVFESEASLHGVYGDVDGRMRAQGWRRDRYEERHHRVIAVYVRGDRQAHVTVVQEGRSGRYRLTIDD